MASNLLVIVMFIMTMTSAVDVPAKSPFPPSTSVKGGDALMLVPGADQNNAGQDQDKALAESKKNVENEVGHDEKKKWKNLEGNSDGVKKKISDKAVQPNQVKTLRMCNISPNLVVVLDDLPPVFKKQIVRVRKLLVAASCPDSFLHVQFEKHPETQQLLAIQLPDPDTIVKLLALDGAVIDDSSVSVRLWQESDIDLFNPCALQNYQPKPPRALNDVNKALALITNEIESHFANCQPRPATVRNRENLMKQFVEWLKVLQTHLDSESESVEIFLELFGSVPSLTSTESSDLDVSFWSKLPLKTDKEELLKCWYELLQKQNSSTGLSFLVLGARVPVVKYYSVANKIEADFTFKDDIGRQRLKSTMVAACVKKDIRVAKLINGIKFWSKRRYIGDASMGSLSSFGHTLLVLHYLQCGCSPPVLPNFFDMAFGDQPIFATHESRDPFQNDAFTNWTTSNMDSLGQLLLGYFQYYGTQWDSLNQMVSLRRARFVPLPKTKDERSLLFHPNHHAHLCIEDPFDFKDNVARNVDQSIGKRIVREFIRGLDMLGQCVSWAELTEDVTLQSNKPWHNFSKIAQWNQNEQRRKLNDERRKLNDQRRKLNDQRRKLNDQRRAHPKQPSRTPNGFPGKNVLQPERVSLPNDRSLRIFNPKLNRKSSRPDKHAGSKSNAILPQPSSAPACAISGITQSASLLSLIPVSSVPSSKNPPKPRKKSRHKRRQKKAGKSSGATINDGHGNTATSNAGLVHAWSEAHSSPP